MQHAFPTCRGGPPASWAGARTWPGAAFAWIGWLAVLAVTLSVGGCGQRGAPAGERDSRAASKSTTSSSVPAGAGSHLDIALSMLRAGQIADGMNELRTATGGSAAPLAGRPSGGAPVVTSDAVPFWLPEVAQILTDHRALADADSLLRSYPRAVANNADLGVLAGQLAYRAGRLDDAVEHFRGAMRDPAVRADAAQELARLELERRHYSEAIDAANAALQLKPDLLPARLALLSALLGAGRPQEALAAAQALPHGAARERFEGEALLAMSEVDSAAVHLQRAVAGQPDSDMAQYLLAQAQLRQGRAEDAARRLWPLAARAHPFEDAQRFLADACAQRGRSARADSLRAAHAVTVRHREALALRVEGLARSAAGDLTGAYELFTRARTLDPQMADLSNDLGAVLARMGRHGEAERELLQAAALAPADPTVQRNLANLYQVMGDSTRRDAALARWEELARAVAKREAAQREAAQQEAARRKASRDSAASKLRGQGR